LTRRSRQPSRPCRKRQRQRSRLVAELGAIR
jgi:hypothetical protein